MLSWVVRLLIFGAGAGIGIWITYLFYRVKRDALVQRLGDIEKDLKYKSNQLEEVELDLRTAIEIKARAEQDAKRLPGLEQGAVELRTENADLKGQVALLNKEQEVKEENLRWVEQAQVQLRGAFESLASQALLSNSEEFLNRAREQMDGLLERAKGDWSSQRGEYKKLLDPLEKTLASMDVQIHDLEQKREGAYQGLRDHLRELGGTNEQIRVTASTLLRALKTPGPRVNWGDMQLRRIVEMSGMMDHVDFNGKNGSDPEHPDMIVYMPNNGILPVDSMTSMGDYLDAMESSDEETREAKLDDLLDGIRKRVLELGLPHFRRQFDRTPEIVAMFVPNDACLGIAFDRDPDLLEFAIQRGVLLTAPITLLALLKTVGYGWQHHEVAENARRIVLLGKQLYERLNDFLGSVNDLGRNLDRSVRFYNKSVGALQSQVFPAARRMRELGAGSGELPVVEPVECQIGPPVKIEAEKVFEGELATS